MDKYLKIKIINALFLNIEIENSEFFLKIYQYSEVLLHNITLNKITSKVKDFFIMKDYIVCTI